MVVIKITVVLCGGGVKGSFQAGFLHSLIKSQKYEIERVYGSSIGAILSPLVANKRVDLLETIFFKIEKFDDIFQKWPWYYFLPKKILMFFKLGYYRKNNIAKLVWDHLNIQEKEKENDICRIKTWNVLDRKEKWFGGSGDSEELYHGMIASSHLWLLVPPYFYKDEYYLDGGACSLFPIEELLSGDFDPEKKVLFIDNSCRNYDSIIRDELPTNALELMHRLHDCTLEQSCTVKLQILKNKYKQNIEIIRPDVDIFLSNIDFNQDKIKKNFELGKAAFTKNENKMFQY